MHAREPYLFEHLPLGLWALLPNGRLERFAVLVDGERLEGIVNPTAKGHIMEFPALIDELQQPSDRQTQRAHGVPNPDELGAWLVRIASPKKLRFDRIGVRSIIPPAIKG